MKKPIKPKAPKKSSPPPNETIDAVWVLARDENKNIILLSNKTHPNIVDEDYNIDWVERGNAGLDTDFEKMQYSELQAAHNIVKQDFKIRFFCDYDGNYNSTIIKYPIKDPDYNSKMYDYRNRFIDYQKKLDQYFIELDKYNKWSNEQKKQKLKQELQELEK